MEQKHNLTIRVVSIIGGILTAFFFLGFLALTRVLRSETSYLLVGSLLIIATLAVSRLVIKSFLDAMNITLYVAGCVLVAFGFGNHINIFFITLIGISILTFLLSRGFILPFLSVITFIISLFGEITHLFSSSYPLEIAAVPVMAAFLLTNLFEIKIYGLLNNRLSRFGHSLSKYMPFHYGLFTSCLVLMGGLSIEFLILGVNHLAIFSILSVFMWMGILVMVQRIMKVMQVDNPIRQTGIYILCLIICLPTVSAPYLSGSLLLILICFHYGYKAECAASLLLFIYAVSKYYYDLNLSLLIKSITLFFVGIGFIAAWYFLTQKRIKHEKV